MNERLRKSRLLWQNSLREDPLQILHEHLYKDQPNWKFYSIVITQLLNTDMYITSKRINPTKIFYEHWETPGGKQEDEDNKDNKKTAFREYWKETRTVLTYNRGSFLSLELIIKIYEEPNNITPYFEQMMIYHRNVRYEEFIKF